MCSLRSWSRLVRPSSELPRKHLVVDEGERQVAVERDEPQRELAHLDGHVVDVGAVEAVGDDLADRLGV